MRVGRPVGRPGVPNSEGVDGVFLRLYTRAQVWTGDLRRRVRGEAGATAVEYAIMVGLIAAVIVVAVTLLGQSTSSAFDSVKFP